MSASGLVADLFRHESAHLIAALVRLLGPANLSLAEDVVHDALLGAMQAWRFGAPADPKAWILQVAKHRAIDVLRRERRLGMIRAEAASDEAAVDLALSPEADAENQLATMFACCDEALSPATHVTLVLRLLCGLSPAEIARAFLVDVATIDRRLHRGRTRLQALGAPLLPCPMDARRHASVEHALYLLFNEGYHGSDADSPLHPALCADALRLAELLLQASAAPSGHALAALFCLHAARLPARLDAEGVLVPLAEQDRTRWNAALLARGTWHLGESAAGTALTRWHLEAGIAYEHTSAASLADTNWPRILQLYDALLALQPSPVVALNRALALAEVHGLEAGREALVALETEPKLAAYSFYWAARADLERRAETGAARAFYERAIELAKSPAERASYVRRL